VAGRIERGRTAADGDAVLHAAVVRPRLLETLDVRPLARDPAAAHAVEHVRRLALRDQRFVHGNLCGGENGRRHRASAVTALAAPFATSSGAISCVFRRYLSDLYSRPPRGPRVMTIIVVSSSASIAWASFGPQWMT